jgi:hypothetical protein
MAGLGHSTSRALSRTCLGSGELSDIHVRPIARGIVLGHNSAMDQRDDYAEPYPPLPPRPGVIKRRALRFGIGILIAGIGAILFFFACVLEIRDGITPTKLSISRANDAAEACRIYYLNNPERKYPTTLAELGSLLSDVDEDIRDGWGNPLHYALVPNAESELEPYVWAERIRNGRTTLHGAKLTADGKTVVFGWPED